VTPRIACRFCRSSDGEIVLDLGRQPASDHFPPAEDPGPDPLYPLRMWLCAGCGLAQLAEDPTVPDEPRGTEPRALVEQAEDAVARVAAAGLLPAGGLVAEYGSPHGGSWLPLLSTRGLMPAGPDEPIDVIVDTFGLMHEADQRAGLANRVARLRPGGVLLAQFHSLAAILRQGQWNALRHGHYAYYAAPVLVDMLRTAGHPATTAFEFALYGGTVLLAARAGGPPDASVTELVGAERAAGVLDPATVRGLQSAAGDTADWLASWLAAERTAGRQVIGYGAASRAVALLCRAGVGPSLLPAIADASPAKQGRRMPGSGIPLISTTELVEARPDAVLLLVPDLLAECRASLPEVESAGGRWVLAERPAGQVSMTYR
jgi:hypothetical protein